MTATVQKQQMDYEQKIQNQREASQRDFVREQVEAASRSIA